ncbi:MAG: hypothetical protein ABS63_01360 [Microbacterium sp. SCN 70-27]|uniref:glycosyltransferase n=1 Tax=unclassified Microbacterium TaxID=2609290 RepID=UPI0008694432|nr:MULTISPECIES: glycosyltransferase [unclassified Microbacterium]MBN9223178.1 glycosyltransferase [Microbacterium sp.]ODT29135.1 MAG: hypothetical protein ABS63_01360 [Microbacterium sp. SCN 70-27]
MREWFRSHGRPVSIVIPSYNDLPLLTAALESIRTTCADVDYEVIIVDDFIDPTVGAELKKLESDRVKVILKDTRLGFAGTVNVGMAAAQHDIVLLNSDIVAQEGWLEALQYSAYAIDPKIGMVSPMLVYPDGRIQYGGTYYARLLAPQWWGHLHVGSPATTAVANVAGYNRSVSGACVYITRDAFARVGLLDDEFWLGFEDVDYGLRAWEAGVRCYYQPAALLIHHESASRGYSQGHRELGSMRRFWRRWGNDFLRRTVAGDPHIDFVLGPEVDPLWADYVGSVAEDLRATGRSVDIHRLSATSRQESVVEVRSARGRVVVACDWSAAETTWLAATGGAVPVFLLPGLETLAFPHDPARQASIIAGYRPEFDYIAPNRETEHRLRAESPWDIRARVAPARHPRPLPTESRAAVVVIGGSDADHRRIEETARAARAEVEFVPSLADSAAIDRIAAGHPRVVVALTDDQNSLVPYALMSMGAVYVAPAESRHSHEVLDGYNALLFRRDDPDGMVSSVHDALTRDEVWSEIRENAHAWVSRAAEAAPTEIARAIDLFCDVPV